MPRSKESIERIYAHNEAVRQAKKLMIDEFKLERGCENPECKWEGDFHPWQLDLDHITTDDKNPKLKKSGAAFWRLGWDSLIKEISKCQVLCSNCHREKTHGEF